MRNSLLLFIFLAFCHSAFGQKNTYWIQGGANYYLPDILYQNKSLSWGGVSSVQGSLGRDFRLTNRLDFSLGLGINLNEFEERREVDCFPIEVYGSVVCLEPTPSRIILTYWSLDPALAFNQPIKNATLFLKGGLRFSHLLNENNSNVLGYLTGELRNLDVGANFSIGVRLDKKLLRPYLVFNHFRGFSTIAEKATEFQGQSVMNSFRHSSIGVQVGIYVW